MKLYQKITNIKSESPTRNFFHEGLGWPLVFSSPTAGGYLPRACEVSLCKFSQTLMQELVPGHESGLAIIEKSEQLLRLLLEIVEVDTLSVSPASSRPRLSPCLS